MSCKIHNNSEYDITDMKPLIRNLYGFAQDRFKFKGPPVINFMSDATNHPMLGKTAHYDPTSMEITVYVDGRHPKDMMRSIAHELVHHKQNLGGMFDVPTMSGQGYAQKDPHLRKMEEEAYLEGNMCFRDWEDGYKSKHKDIFYERRIRKMSTKKWKNKELNTLLNERWGFSMDLSKLNESKKEYDLEENQDRIFAPNHYCLHHVVYEGKEGYTVDHNWNEKLQKVTKYDVKFKDGTIIRNIHESKLTALEAFSEMSHKSGKRDDPHPPAKRDEMSEKEVPTHSAEAAKKKYKKIVKDGPADMSIGTLPDGSTEMFRMSDGGGEEKEEKNELQMKFPDEGTAKSKKVKMSDLKKDKKQPQQGEKNSMMKEAEEMSIGDQVENITALKNAVAQAIKNDTRLTVRPEQVSDIVDAVLSVVSRNSTTRQRVQKAMGSAPPRSGGDDSGQSGAPASAKRDDES